MQDAQPQKCDKNVNCYARHDAIILNASTWLLDNLYFAAKKKQRDSATRL